MTQGEARFDFANREERFTHNCFRYPAKFHPPIAAQLLRDHASPGQIVLDPFCGSGTLNLEADLQGLRSVGLDCDPLAIFVARCKTEVQNPKQLTTWVRRFCKSSVVIQRARSVHVHEQLSTRELAARRAELGSSLPEIPNLEHWYHPAVAIELGVLRDEILLSRAPRKVKAVLWLTFAAIIRGASYADPVPVSGVEVTSHMRKRIEAGYEINVGRLFLAKLKKNTDAFLSLSEAVCVKQSEFRLKDSTKGRLFGRSVGLLVTSPPYQNAVDYYRRHSLEMYWLGLVRSHADRLSLIDNYVGRPRVAKRSPILKTPMPHSEILADWIDEVSRIDTHRALDMRHYFTAMDKVFKRTAAVLDDNGKAVFVVGDSRWRDHLIPTHRILLDVAAPYLELEGMSSYRLKNRHMSYARRNGADINEEYVLVLKKRGSRS